MLWLFASVAACLIALCALAQVAGFAFGIVWHLGAWAREAYLYRASQRRKP